MISKENQIIFLEDEVNLLNQKLVVYEQDIAQLRAEGAGGG